MANPEHITKLKEGIQAWNEWRDKHPGLVPNLQMADLDKANLTEATLAEANFTGATLAEANLRGADLTEADLTDANLTKAYVREADLRGADLHFANLSEADLRRADLRGANLHGANLTKAKLQRALLNWVNLTEADLTEANLSGADLPRANLTGARLDRADFQKANLNWANLSKADLREADLRGTDLRGANVTGTKFTATHVADTLWCDLDLSQAVDLELIMHLAPSSVGLDTLVNSKGRIPEAFLRGCGVPARLIEMQKSLVSQVAPIQFYSCFISYSHRDEEFCRRLHSRMQQEELRVWFAPEEMKGGRKLHEQIDEAIRVFDKLLIVLSEASMGSEWVVTEILKARKRERSEKRQVLFPIRLVDFERIWDWKQFDADTGKDMASEIREYFIPDFSNWKNHDDFEKAFARLLKDLKASA